MAKLRKVQSKTFTSPEAPAEDFTSSSAEAQGALKILDGYVETLEGVNGDIESALKQFLNKPMTAGEKKELEKLLNSSLKYTNGISKRIKRKQ